MRNVSMFLLFFSLSMCLACNRTKTSNVSKVDENPRQTPQIQPSNAPTQTEVPQVIKPAPVEVVAKLREIDLWNEYGGNEIAADQKFKGKYVEMSGKVHSVQKDSSGRFMIGFQIVESRPLSNAELSRMSAKERKWAREGFPANIVCVISPDHIAGFGKVINNSQLSVVAKVVGRKTADVFQNYLVELEDARIVGEK